MDKKDIVEIITEVLSKWKQHSKDSANSEEITTHFSTITGITNSTPSVSIMARMADTNLSVGGNKGRDFKKGFFASANFNQPFTTLKNKRPFISEYDLKQMLANNPTLTVKIPRDAIISPLALEIIESRGIKVIYV